MNELFAGVAGGLGLFIVGMWLLTENLKALATRRLRRIAGRWTGHRFSALVWGALAGAVTQSMSALTFIVVSILRSGLITTQGALALILGGCVGVSALVVIITFNITDRLALRARALRRSPGSASDCRDSGPWRRPFSVVP